MAKRDGWLDAVSAEILSGVRQAVAQYGLELETCDEPARGEGSSPGAEAVKRFEADYSERIRQVAAG